MVVRKESGGWLKRRWMIAGVALFVLLIAGVPLSLTWHGQDGEALASLVRDPLAVFRDRSPGARAGGALLETKARRASIGRPGGGETPSERVLSSVRTRPSVPAVETPGFTAPDSGLPDLFPADVDQASAVGDASEVAQPPLPVGFGDGGGFAGGGGGGGGVSDPGSIGGGGGDPQVTTPPTGGVTPIVPVTSVPEPAIWLSMILGFALTGTALRRSRARRLDGVLERYKHLRQIA